MSKFTKEQLIKTANAEIAEWEMAIERCPDNAKYHQWLRLAEIALAALTAEHAGWQAKNHAGNWMTIQDEDVHHYRFSEELPVREVYTAPPAQTAGMDQGSVIEVSEGDVLSEIFAPGTKFYAAPQLPQPAVDDFGEIRVGRLPTMNQDEYPGLGDWWVQLRIGKDSDEVLARVYGATPREANNRAVVLASRAAMLQGSAPEKMTVEKMPSDIKQLPAATALVWMEGWNACLTAMISGTKGGDHATD